MGIFDAKNKLPLHIVQIILVHVAIGLSVPRLFMKNQPRTRANTIALGMGAKSLFIIFYQILTGHFAYFKRWASLKANLILNSLEIVFWAAVVFLIVQANISTCVGIGCKLSWGVMAVGVVLSILSAYAAAISYFEFREAKLRRRADEERGTGFGMSPSRKIASESERSLRS